MRSCIFLFIAHAVRRNYGFPFDVHDGIKDDRKKIIYFLLFYRLQLLFEYLILSMVPSCSGLWSCGLPANPNFKCANSYVQTML